MFVGDVLDGYVVVLVVKVIVVGYCGDVLDYFGVV